MFWIQPLVTLIKKVFKIFIYHSCGDKLESSCQPMRDGNTGAGNRDIMECVVFTHGRNVNILLTALTPKSIASRCVLIVCHHGWSTKSFNGAITGSPHLCVALPPLMIPQNLITLSNMEATKIPKCSCPSGVTNFWITLFMEKRVDLIFPNCWCKQVMLLWRGWLSRYCAKSFCTEWE